MFFNISTLYITVYSRGAIGDVVGEEGVLYIAHSLCIAGEL